MRSTSLSLGSNAPGVTIANISGTFLIEQAGIAGVLSAGTITITGLPSVVTLGTITNGLFQINTTGAAATRQSWWHQLQLFRVRPV